MLPVSSSRPSELNAKEMIDASGWVKSWGRRFPVAVSHAEASSQVPVTIIRPSGLKTTVRTEALFFRGGTTSLPVAASYSRAVPSVLPIRNIRSSGLIAALSISPPQCTGGLSGLPVVVSQSWTASPNPPVRSDLPPGPKA